MRTHTRMRLRFMSLNGTNVIIEAHPHLVRVVSLEADAANAWRGALRQKLKRDLTDKDIRKYIGRVRLTSYHPYTKLPGHLLTGSSVKLYLDDRHGQNEFWYGIIAAIEDVCVTITH